MEREKTVFIVGAGAHARLVYSILKADGYTAPFVYDETTSTTAPWADCQILHYKDDFEKAALQCGAFAVCMGNETRGLRRVEFGRQLQALGLKPLQASHPTAHADHSENRFGAGNQFLSHSKVHESVTIGDFCVFGFNAAVDHDTVIGHGVTVMDGAIVCGGAKLQDYCAIGAGAIVMPGQTVSEGAIVGAGTLVRKDVDPYDIIVSAGPARVVGRNKPFRS